VLHAEPMPAPWPVRTAWLTSAPPAAGVLCPQLTHPRQKIRLHQPVSEPAGTDPAPPGASGPCVLASNGHVLTKY